MMTDGHCQCGRPGRNGYPCAGAITQEDLLCDNCRGGRCVVAWIGDVRLPGHVLIELTLGPRREP